MNMEGQRPDDALAKTYAAQDSRGQRAAWLGRIRRNLPEIEKGLDIRALHDAFWDVPGIVIGAGPSLEKNAHLLTDVQKKYPLFCCDRAYAKIAGLGVVPQFLMVADMSDDVGAFLEGLETRRVVLVAPTYVSPRVLEYQWKAKFFYNVSDVDKGYTSAAVNLTGGRITSIPGGVIVGNMAFVVAKIAGCNPITFIGSDLSMPEPSSRPGEISYEGKDPDGKTVYSLPGFLSGFEWLLKFLEVDIDTKSNILKVFNSTEGGIMYSERLPALSLKDFMQRYPGVEKSLNTIIDRKIGR